MPATLFGERFIGRREPAWHRLGEVFDENLKITASEAMHKADIMFGIDKHPQVVKLEDGTELNTDSFAVVREPTKDDNGRADVKTVAEQITKGEGLESGQEMLGLPDLQKRLAILNQLKQH